LLQALGFARKRARQFVVEVDFEQILRFRQMVNVRPMLSHSVANSISSTSTVTVPDSIFDKSRMSLISVRDRCQRNGCSQRNRSRRQVAADVLGELLTGSR
jgi:hypothetical protein